MSQWTILPYFGGRHISLLWLHFSCLLDFHPVAVNLTGLVFSTAQFSCSYQLLVLYAYLFKATAASVWLFKMYFYSFTVSSWPELIFTEKKICVFLGTTTTFFLSQSWLLFMVFYLYFLSLVALLASLGTCSVLMLHARCWQQALKHDGRAPAISEAGEDPWFTESYF